MDDIKRQTPIVDATVAKLEEYAKQCGGNLPEGPPSDIARNIGLHANGAFYQAYDAWQDRRSAKIAAQRVDTDEEAIAALKRDFEQLASDAAKRMGGILSSSREAIRLAASLHVNDAMNRNEKLKEQYDEVLQRFIEAENDRDAAREAAAKTKVELEATKRENSALKQRIDELRRYFPSVNEPGMAEQAAPRVAPEAAGPGAETPPKVQPAATAPASVSAVQRPSPPATPTQD